MPVTTSAPAEPIISTLDSEASLGVITSEHGPLPLQSVAISAHIDQLFAEVQVRQGYINSHAETIEATYIFPLPDRAAVSRFQARLGDRLIEGILKERAAARQEYDEAIRQGHRAAIAEEDRPNVFSMRLGNILPGESAEVELTITMPLAYEDGEATMRFPLVVAPRYIPGTPVGDQNVGLGVSSDTDAVPDASRITPPTLLPGYPFPVKLEIQVALAKEIKPTVNLPVNPLSGQDTHSIWKVTPGQKLDRDFLFRFPVARDTIVSQCIIAPDSDNPKEGILTLTVVPPKQSDNQSRPKPRRLVFVLDRSGSMSGWKIVAARRSLGRMIDTLASRDHFAIIAFDDSIEMFPKSLEKELGTRWYTATDSQRFQAIEALARINSRGGTEMLQPLTQAANMLAACSGQEDRVLVFITDGQVGNEDQLFRQLTSKLQGIRVFVLGVDMAPNTSLINRLAQVSGGSTEFVESEERLDEVMQRIHRRIAAPVLTSFSWKPDGIELQNETTVPSQVNDLFPEAPIVIQSRCTLPATGKVILHGTDHNGKPWQQSVIAKVQSSPVLVRSWARARVRAMEDDYAANHHRDYSQPHAIVAHSLKYQVLSRFTAFIAVDRSAVANPNGQPREIIQAVEHPAGWAPQEQDLVLCANRSVHFEALCAAPPARSVMRMMCCEMSDDDDAYPPRMKMFGMPPVSRSAQHLQLTAFRERAMRLLKDYEAAADVNRLAALTTLHSAIAGLTKEMQAANMPVDEIRQLEEVQKLLQSIIADIQLTNSKLYHALDTIRGFALGTPPKRKSLLRKFFWK